MWRLRGVFTPARNGRRQGSPREAGEPAPLLGSPREAGGTARGAPTRFPLRAGGTLRRGSLIAVFCELWLGDWYYSLLLPPSFRFPPLCEGNPWVRFPLRAGGTERGHGSVPLAKRGGAYGGGHKFGTHYRYYPRAGARVSHASCSQTATTCSRVSPASDTGDSARGASPSRMRSSVSVR